ncbi:MAG: transporter, partial [Pseudomonadota bacterium]
SIDRYLYKLDLIYSVNLGNNNFGISGNYYLGHDVRNFTQEAEYGLFNTREELARHTPGNYAGLHFSLTTPTGSYDAGRDVNIGGNRRALKTTLNYSITSDGGESWWDFYPSVRFFSDNDEFGGGSTLSQKPLFGLEAHYSRNVAKGAWISAGLITAFGGETRINGEIREESRQDVRLALGAGFSTWPRGAAFLAYNRNIAYSGGSARISNFMLQLMHQF